MKWALNICMIDFMLTSQEQGNGLLVLFAKEASSFFLEVNGLWIFFVIQNNINILSSTRSSYSQFNHMNKTWATHGDKMETNVTQLLHNFNYLVTISGAYLCHLGTGQEIAIFLYSHLLKMVVFVLTILEQNKWLFVRWRIFSCSMKVKWALKNFSKMVVFLLASLERGKNDCSKEEEWFHFFVKVKRALKIFLY